MITSWKLSVLLAVIALANCSNGTENISRQNAILGEARQVIKSNRAIKNAPQQTPQVTRALIDSLTAPLLAVTIENTGTTAYLLPAAVRRDSTPGRITVWKTPQNEDVVFRSGVLIGTKGIGRDLISADASPVIKSLSARIDGGGLRTLHVRNDINGSNELRLQCEISFVGSSVITMVERSYDTSHFNEKCKLDGALISNDYWIDSGGDVRQSRQWAGHYLGYLSTKLLKK
jgi:hypothetical protein